MTFFELVDLVEVFDTCFEIVRKYFAELVCSIELCKCQAAVLGALRTLNVAINLLEKLVDTRARLLFLQV